MDRPSAASLRPARTLGREALSAGLDTIDVIGVHAGALIELPPRDVASRRGDGMVDRAASFLAEALRPIAAAQRVAVKRTVDVAAVQRRLALEIGRREAVEEALARSERHHGELLEKSRRMQEHLRRLSHEILSAQEEERKRISRELHDEIGQTLTAINVKLATLKKEAAVSTGGLKKRIATTQKLLERSMHTVHRFARELRPSLLDDLGLVPALHAYMKGFTSRTHIPVHFTAFAAVEQLDGDKRTVLYRVAQEAFANVAKHAQASLVRASIKKERDTVRMEIYDNGRSFDVERVLFGKRVVRLGLLGMRERVEMVGGTFTIESAQGKGTTIRAQIPFRDEGSGVRVGTAR